MRTARPSAQSLRLRAAASADSPRCAAGSRRRGDRQVSCAQRQSYLSLSRRSRQCAACLRPQALVVVAPAITAAAFLGRTGTERAEHSDSRRRPLGSLRRARRRRSDWAERPMSCGRLERAVYTTVLPRACSLPSICSLIEPRPPFAKTTIRAALFARRDWVLRGDRVRVRGQVVERAEMRLCRRGRPSCRRAGVEQAFDSCAPTREIFGHSAKAWTEQLVGALVSSARPSRRACASAEHLGRWQKRRPISRLIRRIDVAQPSATVA